MRVISSMAAVAVCLSSNTAATQVRESDEIVVTGETLREARRNAVTYVKELGVAAGEKPTARWFDPICPRALGLDPAKATMVEAHVREVASSAGARLAGEGCQGNLIVVFTDDGSAVATKIARKTLLGTSHPNTARELKEGSAPIRWWYNISPRSKEATAPGADQPPAMEVVTTAGRGELPSNGRPVVQVSSSSHISTQTVQAIDSATVIVDVRLSEGATLKAVSEYAGLVGLAQIKLGAAPPNSVLALFEGDRSERGLTSRDRAFLSALYRVSMDRRSDQQRRSIVINMVEKATSRQ